MRERIRALSERSEFFLVITLSFAYIVAASITVLFLRIRTFEVTTGIAIQDTVTEIAILLVVGWILHVRGWSVRRLTKPFSWSSLLSGVLLFLARVALHPSPRPPVRGRVLALEDPMAMVVAHTIANFIAFAYAA